MSGTWSGIRTKAFSSISAEAEHYDLMQVSEQKRWTGGARSDYHKTKHCLVLFSELYQRINDKKGQKGT
jgi:hypothetical protein